MGKIRAIITRWRQQIKFAAYDPQNFDELWGFTTSSIRLFSLLLLLVLIVGGGIGVLLVKSPLGVYFGTGNDSPDRRQLEEQRTRIAELDAKLNAQDKYIANIRSIILGEVPGDSISQPKALPEIDPSDIHAAQTSAEQVIAEKVKSDQRTGSPKMEKAIVHFIAPVRGLISQGFDGMKHPAVDVVAPENKTILTCLSGTVIYSGYSQKDGNLLLIAHANNFVSVYKHAKTRLKKTGDKVHTGDPIATVGSSGENSSGPHLHFELWLNQMAVNPSDYIRFE